MKKPFYIFQGKSYFTTESLKQLWRRLYCTYSGYAADFSRPDTGKNIVILSKYNLKKGKPAGVKSLIGLFYISFSLSNFVAKNVYLFDKINEDL